MFANSGLRAKGLKLNRRREAKPGVNGLNRVDVSGFCPESTARETLCVHVRCGYIVIPTIGGPGSRRGPEAFSSIGQSATSITASAKTFGASCGRLWPMPLLIVRCAYLPPNLLR